MPRLKPLALLLLLVARGASGEFRPNVRVNDQDILLTRQEAPALAAAAGKVYAAWFDYREGEWNLYFARSQDGGQSFEPDAFVEDTAAPTYEPGTVAAAADASGKVILAWTGYHRGNWDLYVSRSTDSGQSFSRRIRIGDAGFPEANQMRPTIG